MELAFSGGESTFYLIMDRAFKIFQEALGCLSRFQLMVKVLISFSRSNIFLIFLFCFGLCWPEFFLLKSVTWVWHLLPAVQSLLLLFHICNHHIPFFISRAICLSWVATWLLPSYFYGCLTVC